MFTRILVPTDFSPASDAALGYARELAGAFNASLSLLHILDPTFLRAVVADPHDRDAAALRRLDERLTAEDRRRFRAESAIEHADVPAEQILSYARTQGIDLVVMGTHGHRGIAHLLLGSVAEQVVRHAPCPVLTLRDAPRRGATHHEGPSRILVPTDFSAPSDYALDCARGIAERCGASLHLLHVLEEAIDTAAFGTEVFVADSPEVRAARLEDARERLAHRVATGATAPATTTEILVGSSGRSIARYADEQGFDLIVMGTHGRAGFAHLVMGSVAEHVVRTAPCPVLTLRQPPEQVPTTARGEDRGAAADRP